MIVNGKEIAEGVYTRLKSKRPLTLGILIAGSDSVTDAFVRAKERAAARLGVSVVREVIAEGTSTEDALRALASLACKADGMIVQLPLPSQIDTEKILVAIPPEKDVDGISPTPKVRPPVAGAVEEILRVTDVNVTGKLALVVGHGRLVGKPVEKLLRELGARVEIAKDSTNFNFHAPRADIIVLGVGEPGMVKPEHLKAGVVLIDAGTSESSGKIVGDADPRCAEKASLFTPVPGGVGPIAVAMIFKNLFELVTR